MIPAIIAGGILLLFILLFSIRFSVTLDVDQETALTVRWLFFTYKILPKKQKKYKPKNYTLKKIRKREEKARKKALRKKERAKKKALEKAEKRGDTAGLSKKEKRALKKKRRASRPALPDLIALICRVLKLFSSRFFGKLRIKVARLHIRVGAADAMQTAVTYGLVNQSVQYLTEGMKKFTHVKGLRRADVLIEPDFLSEKIEFSLKMTFSLSLGNLVGALLKSGWKFLVGYSRIKPDPDHPNKRGGVPRPPRPPKAPRPAPVPRHEPRA